MFYAVEVNMETSLEENEDNFVITDFFSAW